MVDPMHPGDRTYRNTSVRLAELAVVSNVLERLTFENCTIHGPAVIIPLDGTQIRECGFDADEEATVWEIGNRTHVVGAIGLRNCIFVRCRVFDIGLAVRPQERENILRGFDTTS
jgi:hypothetical protein